MHRIDSSIGTVDRRGPSRRRRSSIAVALLATTMVAALLALPAAPAGAVAPGSISGTITDGSGTPFDGDHTPTVALHDVNNPGPGGQPLALTTANGSGTYTFSNLDPGTYFVWAAGSSPHTEPNGAAYREVYGEGVSWYNATKITVGSGQAVTGVNIQLNLTNGCPPVIGGSGPYPDVPNNTIFCLPIDWLAKAGISTGYPDGTFQPAANVTRQAMAGFLYKYLGDPGYTPPVTPSFSDVPTGHQFYKAIEWLKASGIASGYPDGTFKPTDKINRGPIASMLYKAAGNPSYTAPTEHFPDVPADHPFRTAIEWLYVSGITSGYGDGTFKPAAPTTRQAMSVYLYEWDVNAFLQEYTP